MENLILRYSNLTDAEKSLNRIIEKIKKEKKTTELYEIYRDSVIKRFELVYDVFWKYLKHYLDRYHGIVVNSPKSVFRECQGQKIIDENQLRTLLKMVDDRNLTTHTYNEETANKITENIYVYNALLNTIIPKIKPQ
jgi:nucleotidyltransferase substrate binding protein (TIGR01987 family)